MAGEEGPKQSGDKEECPWCRYMKRGGCREPFEVRRRCATPRAAPAPRATSSATAWAGEPAHAPATLVSPPQAWQACVDAAMGDGLDASARRAASDACTGVTGQLFECMVRHKDYYGPQLAEMGGGGSGGASEPAAARGGSGGSEGSSGDGAPAQARVSVAAAGGQPAAASS